MAKKPNETRLAKVGTSTGFVISKRVSALVGEMGDTFKIEVDSRKGEITLKNMKNIGGNLNE